MAADELVLRKNLKRRLTPGEVDQNFEYVEDLSQQAFSTAQNAQSSMPAAPVTQAQRNLLSGKVPNWTMVTQTDGAKPGVYVLRGDTKQWDRLLFESELSQMV